MKVEFYWQRRKAKYTVEYPRPALGLQKGDIVEVHVLGLFQVADGEDVNPYFVIELLDGRTNYAAPGQITFVDIDENGEIICDS